MRAIPGLAETAALPLQVLPPGRRLAEAMREGESSPAFQRVLRVAISLRGGVSLAVWMAGALAELDLVRRIRIVRQPDRSLAALVLSPQLERPSVTELRRISSYARVLAAAGYDEVQFDVIAGASAGGLSAVLYAVAQRAGTALESVLPVWRDPAGLRNLLQPPGLRSVEAPLRGDAYFWRTATRAAAELHRRGGDPAHSHPDLVPARLAVHLAATVINSESESEPDVQEGLGHFVFAAHDGRRGALPNGIPGAAADPGSEAPEVQLLRLAYAARATSSLPGGFEVARVRSPSVTRREALEESRALEPFARSAIAEAMSSEEHPGSAFATGRLRPSFAFAFSSHRPRGDGAGHPYEVIDGGIFDNVPIDRALRAIKATVGATYGDRALLDLDPDPEPSRRGALEPTRSVVPLWSVLAAWAQRVRRRESAAEELEEVHRFNAELTAEQGRLDALAALVAGLEVGGGAADERLRGYLRSLGGADARFLVEAVSHPSRWQLMSTLPLRRRLHAVSAQHLAALLPALTSAYQSEADAVGAATAIPLRPSALMDAGHAVLAWVRAIESRGGAEDPAVLEVLRRIREHIADALTAARRARDAATFRVLVLAAHHAAEEPDSPLDRPTADVWARAWFARGSDEEGRARRASEEAALAAHHRRLGEDIAALRSISPPGQATDDAGVPWAATVWQAVDERFGATDLTTVELIALVASAGMQPPMSLVATGRISGDEPPADPAAFPTVMAEERRRALQQAIDDHPEGTERPGSTAGGKLAGRGLGNLAGLLSEDWRMNDWWWGRLDGAAGILRFLASRSATAQTDAIEELVRLNQDALREEVGEEETLRAGADALANLSPEYRTAMATRALSALLRSAAPPPVAGGGRATVAPPGWQRAGFLLLETLLRPLLLLVPLAAAPVRLLVALGAVAGLGWQLTTAPEPGARGGLWVIEVTGAVLAAAAVALVILGATRRPVGRWRALSSGRTPLPAGVTAEDSDRARQAAAGVSNAAGAVAVVAAALLGWSAAEGRLLAAAGWLLVTFGAAVWSVRARRSVPPLQAPVRGPRALGGVAAFALLAVAGPVLSAVVPDSARLTPWAPLAELIAFAAVFSLVFVWRWERPAKALVAVLAAAGVWLLCWMVQGLVEVLPGVAAGWLAPVAFLITWSNVLWWALMLRPASSFPPDTPERTPSPRWFADARHAVGDS